jgi:2-oxo-4-hydroxy-4-carboxy-5-ureidoimidazoline decarboxylase
MSTQRLQPQLTEIDRIEIRLAALNDCAPETAHLQFRRCCGSSRWIELMTTARPFLNVHQLEAAADRMWELCAHADWLEAFKAHPRIGEQASTRWSRQEQSGIAGASTRLLDSFAMANQDYETKFGYTFIVCAAGKSAPEILAALHQRLRNDPALEIVTSAEQQRLITRLRLRRLLSE